MFFDVLIGTAPLPCSFGPDDLSLCRDWGGSSCCQFGKCSFGGVHNRYDYGYNYDSSCDHHHWNYHLHPEYKCNCKWESGKDSFLSLRSISHCALAFLIILAVKELLKAILVLSICCSRRCQDPKYMKFAMNSPLVLCLMWIPNVYGAAINSMALIKEDKEEPWNAVVDILLQDALGMVIPIWYFHNGREANGDVYVAGVISFIFTLLSLIINMIMLSRTLNWRRCYSTVQGQVVENAFEKDSLMGDREIELSELSGEGTGRPPASTESRIVSLEEKLRLALRRIEELEEENNSE